MARGDFPSSKQDQFVLRFPDGLRDRIKAYAEAHGRSMNAEIVRVLEREYPAPWSVYDRIDALLEITTALHRGAGFDEGIEKLVKSVQDTVEGILSGRVRDVDDEARDIIAERYDQYRTDINQMQLSFDYDEEELEQINRDGTTAKFVDPFEEKK
jgi:hypothetical protein